MKTIQQLLAPGAWCIMQTFVLCAGMTIALPYSAIAGPISYKAGSDGRDVSVTSSSAGVQVVSSIRRQASIMLVATATVDVWLFPTNGTCSSALTTQKGFRISADTANKLPTGWQFIPEIDGWSGQICAILETGLTAQTLKVVEW